MLENKCILNVFKERLEDKYINLNLVKILEVNKNNGLDENREVELNAQDVSLEDFNNDE